MHEREIKRNNANIYDEICKENELKKDLSGMKI